MFALAERSPSSSRSPNPVLIQHQMHAAAFPTPLGSCPGVSPPCDNPRWVPQHISSMKQGFQDGYLTNKPTQTPGRLMSSTSDTLPSHNAGWERKTKPPNPHVVARGAEFNPVPRADEVSFGFVLFPPHLCALRKHPRALKASWQSP